MEWPASQQWPAVALVVVGGLLLLGTLLFAGTLVSGFGEPTNTHTVERTDAANCDPDEVPDGPRYAYSELSPDAQSVFDEALAGGEARTDSQLEAFQYATPPPDNQVGLNYVTYEGDCYELYADAGAGAVGDIVAGVLLLVVLAGGGGGGLGAIVAGVISYRTEPRLAPACFAFLFGVGLFGAARMVGLPLAEVLLLVSLVGPVAVWWALTRRGWDDLP